MCQLIYCWKLQVCSHARLIILIRRPWGSPASNVTWAKRLGCVRGMKTAENHEKVGPYFWRYEIYKRWGNKKCLQNFFICGKLLECGHGKTVSDIWGGGGGNNKWNVETWVVRISWEYRRRLGLILAVCAVSCRLSRFTGIQVYCSCQLR